MEKVPMTAEGYSALEAEIKHLKTVERPRIIKAIAEARVADLEDIITRAEVIDVSRLSGDSVKFGATVKLVDEDTEQEVRYQIVGEVEADVKQSKISITSPIARALLGKSAGDTVEVSTPGGGKCYEILKVDFV